MLAEPVIRHGYGTYSRGLCKCAICRSAKAERMRSLRNERRRRLRWQQEHGSGRHLVLGITHGYAGYQDAMCRCEICTTARTDRDRMRSRTRGSR